VNFSGKGEIGGNSIKPKCSYAFVTDTFYNEQTEKWH